MTYYMMKKKLAELLEDAITERMRKKAKHEYSVAQDIQTLDELTVEYIKIVEEYDREHSVCAKGRK